VPIDWVKSLFETNYLGAIRMVQAVLPGMRERRSGAIVNVSSIAGRLAIAGHGHYSAVKHALEAISEALAQEVVEFGIRVAIVEPGVVVTPIFTKAKRFADPKSPYAAHVHRLLLFYQMQMKMPSQPADVARVIHEAVTTKTPKLRYLVGQDAEMLVAGRRKLTDEEYVETGRAIARREVSRADAPALRVHLVENPAAWLPRSIGLRAPGSMSCPARGTRRTAA
jgi:NAD(P)-dependent dehydrogenase (short-subunit alcohol dehydrogenase family)